MALPPKWTCLYLAPGHLDTIMVNAAAEVITPRDTDHRLSCSRYRQLDSSQLYSKKIHFVV